MTLDLLTRDTELHALQLLLDQRRKGTTHIKVPVEALEHLVRDHATLYSAATGPAVKVGRDGVGGYGATGKGHRVKVGPDQESMRGEAEEAE